MKLINMLKPKLSKKEEDKFKQPSTVEGECDRYPWGLKLNFEKESIDKIPALQKVGAGSMVNIQAVGKVIEVRITDEAKGRKRHNVEIQIQKLGIESKDSFDQAYDEIIKK